MPIGAKLYEQAAKPAEETKADEAKSDDKEGPIEGEVVDDKKE